MQLSSVPFCRGRSLAALISLVAIAAGLAFATRKVAGYEAPELPIQSTPRFSELACRLSSRSVIPADQTVPLELVLERGQTLNGLLSNLGLEARSVNGAVDALRAHVDPRSLQVGQNLTAFVEADSKVRSLEMRVGDRGRVALREAEGEWQSSWNEFERRVEPAMLSGRLEASLDQAIQAVGGEPILAYKMADIFQWDLDFSRDLQRGDRFQILYEKVYLDGQYAGSGRILALSYRNVGRLHEAFAFGEETQYFDGMGRPLRKMFLRSPLKYSRVTSRFTHRRFHPILKKYRPHYGVDYGAPTGTPARVTAAGVVSMAGWDRGGGKTVKVRHPNGYVTAYLHLSRYGEGIRAGHRVEQGDVIGYVGSTGLSTAPHLDYRVQHNGRWIDPLQIKSVPAEPVAEAEMAAFLTWREDARRRLKGAGEGEPIFEIAAVIQPVVVAPPSR